MDEDTEYLKLPLEERMVHKLWKARVSGYEDAKKLFGQVLKIQFLQKLPVPDIGTVPVPIRYVRF
jgi:hypothetical protein